MSGDALVFMVACWTGVLGLASWSLWRVVRTPVRADSPDPE